MRTMQFFYVQKVVKKEMTSVMHLFVNKFKLNIILSMHFLII